MHKLHILVFDNDVSQLEALLPAVERQVANAGFESRVEGIVLKFVRRASDGRLNDDSVRDVLDKSLASRPDLVFFDNHFGDEGGLDIFGFDYIAHIKGRFPDVVFFLVTRENVPIEAFNRFPQPDGIFNRLRFTRGDAEYDKYFTGQFRRSFRRVKIGEIRLKESVQNALPELKTRGRVGQPIKPPEFRSLIEQLCYMDRVAVDGEISVVELDKLEGGFSGDLVCTIEIEPGGKRFQVPAVVKLASRENAGKETINHARYVKWMLPYTWRVDVLGTAESEYFGGICYSFAHGGSEQPISLATAIKRGHKKQIRDVISAVFDPKRQTWYSQTRTAHKDIGLYLSTNLPYFDSDDARVRKIRRVKELIKSKLVGIPGVAISDEKNSFALTVEGDTIDLGGIQDWPYSENWRIDAIECICHGDMNAGNIMVRPDSSAFAFIDFRHTGWHHWTRDFCSMESSVRTLLSRDPDVKGFVSYYKREIQRNREEGALLGASNVEDTLSRLINEDADKLSDRDYSLLIRGLFISNFPGSTLKEYYLAQMSHCAWLLAFEKPAWQDNQIEILLANFVALAASLRVYRPRMGS